MAAAGLKKLECDKCIFFHLDQATKKFVLVGCEVDDLIVTGNADDACIARFKKKVVDDYKVTDWERIAPFLGGNMDYDFDSGVLAMDVKSKIEKLFEDHSILNVLKIVKAPTPSLRRILTCLAYMKRSGLLWITTSPTSMHL